MPETKIDDSFLETISISETSGMTRTNRKAKYGDKFKVDHVIENRQGMLHVKYDSYMSLMSAIKDFQPIVNKLAGEYPYSGFPFSSISGTESFTETESLDEAIQYATNGWKDGIEKAEKAISKFLPLLESKLKDNTLIYADEGQVIDIQSFINGESEYWLNMMPIDVEKDDKAQSKGLLTIGVNFFASCTIKTNTILGRGIIVFALSQLLELCGYSVRIIAECTMYNGSGNTEDMLSVEILIKDFGQAIDLGVIAFALGHPSNFRRIFFAVCENLYHCGLLKNRWEGYGNPVRLEHSKVKDKCDIYFENLKWDDDEPRYKTVEGMQAFTIEMLQAQGIEISL